MCQVSLVVKYMYTYFTQNSSWWIILIAPWDFCHARIQKGGLGVRIPKWSPTQENHKLYAYLGILENHKATQPAFNVGPLTARQRNEAMMARF